MVQQHAGWGGMAVSSAGPSHHHRLRFAVVECFLWHMPNPLHRDHPSAGSLQGAGELISEAGENKLRKSAGNCGHIAES